MEGVTWSGVNLIKKRALKRVCRQHEILVVKDETDQILAYFVIDSATPRYPLVEASPMPGETISPEHAASLVKSGMWLDYGATLCEPDVFDKALAARKDELENVKIRTCLSMRPRAVIEEDPEGKHFHLFSWHFSAYERRKHDVGRCNYTPLNLGEVPDYYRRFLDPVDIAILKTCPMDDGGLLQLWPDESLAADRGRTCEAGDPGDQS